MNVRERMEQEEYEFLSPQAQKAAKPFLRERRCIRSCFLSNMRCGGSVF